MQLNKYDVTAIVRDSGRADHLKSKTGVKVVVADLNSSNLPDIASEFDAILHTADADHVAGAQSFIAGLEKRAATSSSKPILIHTSGTGVLIDKDEPKGKYKSEKIYSDGDLSTYHALPPTQLHKNVDDIVLDAGRRGTIDAIAIAPPTIWGTGQGEFNTHSIQVPLLVKVCIEAKSGLVVEDGINTWSMIHVADLSAAYLTLLDAAIQGKLPTDPMGRYFFVENGEYEQRQVAEVVTKLLYKRGKVEKSEPKKLTVEEVLRRDGGTMDIAQMTGGNSRSKAVLLRKLGWEAKRGGNKEFLESIKDDVDYIVQKGE